MTNSINEENILIQAGLSEEQALVYDTLLERGPQKASNLSDWTGVKRGLTYKVLEQLEIMGLVEKKGGEGTVATFYPQHPSLLMHTLEGREKELALAKEMLTFSLGTLSSKYNLIAGKPSVQFFEGAQAVERITRDYPNAGEEIRQIIDIGHAMESIPSETKNYQEERLKKKISKRMIVTHSDRNKAYIAHPVALTTYKTIDAIDSLSVSIQVYGDKVSILELKKENIIGLLIENVDIADSMKKIFDALWEKSS